MIVPALILSAMVFASAACFLFGAPSRRATSPWGPRRCECGSSTFVGRHCGAQHRPECPKRPCLGQRCCASP
eukprot:10871592-Alexandrium_andersonii.AAC.1